MARQKVIFDTDPGVDDAMALLYIESCGVLDLLGITTVLGNADIEHVTRNALYIKQRFGLKAPVARGADAPLKRPRTASPTHVHGDNGLGNVAMPAHIEIPLDPRPAYQLIIDEVRRFPGEVVLIAVGRMTNLALALEHDPEIAKLVKGVSIMGGAFGGHGHFGNVTPVAEANIIGDPDAADMVMTAPWPVTVVGLDVTHETIMNAEFQARLRDECGDAGKFMWEISRVYDRFYRSQVGLDGIACHDSLAVAYVVDPSLFQVRRGPIRVVTDGIAIGQTIQNTQRRKAVPGAWDGHPAQSVCTEVDAKRFLASYLDAFRAAAK